MELASDPSDSNCLICISPCKELSTDLFLYNCECIYMIHKECFLDWRRVSKTNRICIICPEELLPIRAYPPGVVVINRRIDPSIPMIVNFFVVPLLGVGLVVVISFVIQYVLTSQIPSLFDTKNNYLFPSRHEEL
jgi:hypothetical protein